MEMALLEASKSVGEVPVGAVLVDISGVVIAAAHNEREASFDPTAHAEIQAIRKGSSRLRDRRLDGCTLFVTLEPCVMCAGAIVAARIPRVVFGAWDIRVGASGSLFDILRDSRLGRPVEVTAGLREQECSALLQNFFDTKRKDPG